MLPVGDCGPVFGGEVDEVDGRVFDVGVGHGVGELAGEAAFEFGVGGGGGGVGAQVVAEEERVALVGAAEDADVGVGHALAGGLAQEPFLPVAVGAGAVGWAVVADDAFGAGVAQRGQGCKHFRGEGSDGDLDVDDVLGGEAGDRGGADVVDAEGEIAEGVTKGGGDGGEIGGPGGLIVDNGRHRCVEREVVRGAAHEARREPVIGGRRQAR